MDSSNDLGADLEQVDQCVGAYLETGAEELNKGR